MSDSDSSDGQANIPSREECENRSQEFASLTNTDSALAFFFLQQNQWSLVWAVDAYFRENEPENNSRPQPNETKCTIATNVRIQGSDESNKPESLTSAKNVTSQKAATSTASDGENADPQPQCIRVLSWNIDGLDQRSLDARTKAVCDIINKEKPDVVYLQEVIPRSLQLIEEMCPTFQVISGYCTCTAMLLSITSVEYEKHNLKQFLSSLIYRNILSCKAKVKGVAMTLMTSHLESTAEHAQERKSQLKTLLQDMRNSDDACTVLAAGDFNLRGKELVEVGGLPDNTLDVWEVTGKRQEAKFTWDLMRNDNLECERRIKPRYRFDRMFLRHPAQGMKLKPVYFELVGIERIKSCGRFPSDHWGILGHFNKT